MYTGHDSPFITDEEFKAWTVLERHVNLIGISDIEAVRAFNILNERLLEKAIAYGERDEKTTNR